MVLREYQKECIETVDKLPDGARTIACLATGLGKTVTAAHFNRKGRVLWISHRDELVRQPERYFTEQGLTYGIEKADEHENGEDIVSASIQSISRDSRLFQFKPDEFDIIICDEAQHAAAPTYRKVLDYFKPRKLIGLTATPKRGDNVKLSDVFDDICFTRDLRWGIENGYLARIRCLRVNSNFRLDNVEKNMGDYTASGLSAEMETSNDDIVVAKAYMEHCLPNGRKTLIYCPSIKICNKVASTLKKALPDEEKDTVEVLSDKIPPDIRRTILDKYKKGEVKCIINCMILTEGTDLPDTGCIINNRPTTNDTLYQQIVGRGTRLAEGKEYCLVIDIVNGDAVKHDLCTAPTLFGIDPALLPRKAQKEMEENDLLEFSSAVLEERAKIAKHAVLIQHMIDIFTQERVGMIKDNSKDGLRRVADLYRQSIENNDLGYDFGDILVKTTPYDSKYFRIDPTFNGKIYLSKPDMLDKTVVSVNIPEVQAVNNQKISFITDPMPMEEAIGFVTDILNYIVPETYRSKWSKSTRDNLSRKKATDRQIWRIEMDYKKYGVYEKGPALSMLQASDLIDMNLDIERMKHDTAVNEEMAKDAEKVRKGKQLDKWYEKQQKIREREEALEKYRKSCAEKIVPVLKEEIRMRKEKQYLEENEFVSDEIREFPVKFESGFYRNSPSPSSRQIEYIWDLLAQIEEKGGKFDVNITPPNLKMDMMHTGMLITYLVNAVRVVKKYKHYYTLFMVSEYMETIKEMNSLTTDGITGRYRILRKEEKT